MFPEWENWRHVVKLDPDKPSDEWLIEQVVGSGTDAIIVGGTQNITREKVLKLFKLLKPYTLPKILEVSTIESITFGFDGYLIPVVLNAGNPKWIIGAHKEAAKLAGDMMDWKEVLPEGYIILNPDCAVAKLTEALYPLRKSDVLAYARCGENLFSLPLIYIEYSGSYGNPELVSYIKSGLTKARVFYGGGIDNAQKAEMMGKAADTIVVGNMIYTDSIKFLKDTVKAAKMGAGYLT
ncbi:MAG: heptaprenylglyceryl phosphate synthase [Tepidanaerobacteraceae bacterium]|nr:heptaprenylglyceryl phosphate synthase [Tepidanaerobacteraceae bacterium]